MPHAHEGGNQRVRRVRRRTYLNSPAYTCKLRVVPTLRKSPPDENSFDPEMLLTIGLSKTNLSSIVHSIRPEFSQITSYLRLRQFPCPTRNPPLTCLDLQRTQHQRLIDIPKRSCRYYLERTALILSGVCPPRLLLKLVRSRGPGH